MPLQATSGAASYDAFGGGVPVVPNYIEDVFSTTLYTGNGGAQTITTGVDLSTDNGLLWIKNRIAITGHCLIGPSSDYHVSSNLTDPYTSRIIPTYMTAITTTGFSVGTNNDGGFIGSGFGSNDKHFVAWSFRKQPKFFDVVYFQGDGTSSRNISHQLASKPHCILLKNTTTAQDWFVSHIGVNSGLARIGKLNNTNAFVTSSEVQVFYSNDSTFRVGDAGNISGDNYVAYLFAHNAGGFGLTGTENVISCGSFTTDGTGIASVNLGYEPQFVLYKTSTSIGDWVMADNMRQLTRPTSNTDDSIFKLSANLDIAEIDSLGIRPTSTGFDMDNSGFASKTFIYIAIRRGPMKTPTTATSVFSPTAYTATNTDNRLVNTGITTDMVMARNRTTTSAGGFYTADRMRGDYYLQTALTVNETIDPDSFMTPNGYGNTFSTMFGFGCGNDITRRLNYSNLAEIAYAFRRAPKFFDQVCFVGTGSNRTVTHNLGAVPELMIVKDRSVDSNWSIYSATLGATQRLRFNDQASQTLTGFWNNTAPTSSVFTVGTYSETNQSGDNFVAYLFATCPQVSKVGSYTGTGTTKQVDCGFTSGARFVLIKRTDAIGDWYVWDSGRGIVSGNDPYLLINSTALEDASTDYIDTYNAGFEISSTAPAAVNASGGTFIFLAIS
jgi:hypothetical protein